MSDLMRVKSELTPAERARQAEAWKSKGEAWLKRCASIARELRRLDGETQSAMWEAGDAILEGRAQFGGMHAKTAMPLFDYSLASVYIATSVANRIPPFRRIKGLSFYHHFEVAPLEEKEQDRLLALALKHNWSVRELREQ